MYKLESVRYAAVINSLGERILGGMKLGVTNLSSDSDERKYEFQSVITLKMAQNHESDFGMLHYSAMRWDKIVALYFLLSKEYSLNLTIYGDTPLEKVFEIERIVKEWKAGYHGD